MNDASLRLEKRDTNQVVLIYRRDFANLFFAKPVAFHMIKKINFTQHLNCISVEGHLFFIEAYKVSSNTIYK